MFLTIKRAGEFLRDAFDDKNIQGILHPLSVQVTQLSGMLSRGLPKNHPNYRGLQYDIEVLQNQVRLFMDDSIGQGVQKIATEFADSKRDDIAILAQTRSGRRYLQRGLNKQINNVGGISLNERTLKGQITALEGRIQKAIKNASKTGKSTLSYSDTQTHHTNQQTGYQPSEASEIGRSYEALMQIRARVDTLRSRDFSSGEYEDELCKIVRRVLGISIPPNSEVSVLIDGILTLVSEIYEEKDSGTTDGTGEKQEDGNIDNDIPMKDIQKESRYIDSLLAVLSHNISSTKQNGHATHGDGSFVTKIFRPFLQALRSQLLGHKNIDVSNTSWKEIVDIYKSNIDDQDPARMHFLGILQKSTSRGTFLDICDEPLLDAIRRFSVSNYYKDHKSALQNVLGVLTKNPPTSR